MQLNGKNSKMDDVGRSRGTDEGGPTIESRDDERARPWERGRHQLRWEDCVKRDARKAERNVEWRERGADREHWKGITAGAMQPHPLSREQRGRTERLVSPRCCRRYTARRMCRRRRTCRSCRN